MVETPRGHRWYQFRLSTVLALVAICAWTMALRPFLDLELADLHIGTDDDRPTIVWYTSHDPWSMRVPLVRLGPAPQLYGPALALVVLLGWKSRSISDRPKRRRKSTWVAH